MDEAHPRAGTTAKVPVERLHLDRGSPRLAGREEPATDESIIARLYSEGLDELLQSISTNGYLDIEPLVAMDVPGGDGMIVLEGNRRLATLRLLREPELVSKIASSEKVRIATPDVDDSLRHTFDQVTVYRVATREEARAFIGFKHINGPAKWNAYAKTRFAANWHREEASIEWIANALGDRHGTVKRMVSAIYVLEQATMEGLFDIEDRYTPKFNFAHLFAALSRSQYREHLGLAPIWPPDEPRPDPIPGEKLGLSSRRARLDLRFKARREAARRPHAESGHQTARRSPSPRRGTTTAGSGIRPASGPRGHRADRPALHRVPSARAKRHRRRGRFSPSLRRPGRVAAGHHRGREGDFRQRVSEHAEEAPQGGGW